MKSTINQAPGTWYNMEQEWRNALNGGGTVTDIEINITYPYTIENCIGEKLVF